MISRAKHSLLALSLCCLLINSVLGQAAEPGQRSTIKPLLQQFCIDCHADAPEGGLDLQNVSYDLQDEATFAVWERVFDRVANGEMPPSDAQEITPAMKKSFLAELQSVLSRSHQKRKETVLRRLNRREYTNTLNDLFGVSLDLEALFPEDSRAHEFDNVGSALSLSMVHMQRYIDAADQVLDAAIAKSTQAPLPNRIQTNYAETREGEKHIGEAWGQAPDGAVVFYRALGYPTGMLRTASARRPGRYRVKITGYAYQSDQPITFEVGGTTFVRGAPAPTYGYYSFQPGRPQTIEIDVWMDERYMLKITPWGISDDQYLIKKHGIENYQGPGLAINGVEMEGPLVDVFPTKGHELIFREFEHVEIEPSNPSVKQKSWYQPKFEVTSDAPRQAAQSTLERLARSAFRRPVKSSDVDKFVQLFARELDASGDMQLALRTSIIALLCSTDFLFFHEEPVDANGLLDAHAVANRLSYLLTRTAPDEPLKSAAESGQILEPEKLIEHTERLLADERLERFVVDFTDAWLNLRDIEFTTPDKDLFPEFDAFLQFSMVEETRRYFRSLIENNAPVRELVKSDYAFLNNRLAKLYKIEGVAGPQLRRVLLPKGSARGGMLGQAAIHKVTANGTNTSPVVRGVWVTERLLGKKVPPPPPGISGVEPDIRGAKTLRELLDKHRDADNCRACHAMIDPPGFALESFNPIGGWRENFRSTGDGRNVKLVVNGRKVRYKLGLPVDASGELPGGEGFRGYRQFRDLIASQERQLASCLASKFLTFATGREMGFSDRRVIEDIVASVEANDFRVKDLLHACIQSEIFRSK